MCLTRPLTTTGVTRTDGTPVRAGRVHGELLFRDDGRVCVRVVPDPVWSDDFSDRPYPTPPVKYQSETPGNFLHRNPDHLLVRATSEYGLRNRMIRQQIFYFTKSLRIESWTGFHSSPSHRRQGPSSTTSEWNLVPAVLSLPGPRLSVEPGRGTLKPVQHSRDLQQKKRTIYPYWDYMRSQNNSPMSSI